MRNIYLLLILTALPAGRIAAQCSVAPPEFAATCKELEGHLTKFDALVNAGWNGEKYPVAFAAELLAANDNRGLRVLLQPDTMAAVREQLRGFSHLGLQAVTVAVGFPILYPPFYEFNKDPKDYDTVLGFYRSVMAELRKQGLKVVIENSVIFPRVAQDLQLDRYYATLSDSQLTAGRAQVAVTIARELKPDWLNLGSEPDTQSVLLRKRGGYGPREYAAMISTVVNQLRSAGIKGQPQIGAGVGAWNYEGSAYVKELAATGLDYIDLHTYSVNLDHIDKLVKLIDQAHAAGKGVGISEAWLKKVSDSDLRGRREVGIIRMLSEATRQNSFSFWQPLDSEFLDDLVKLAHWKHISFVSPFPSTLFFSYTDYKDVGRLDPRQLNGEEIRLAVAAMRKGELSAVGKAYAAAIKSPRR